MKPFPLLCLIFCVFCTPAQSEPLPNSPGLATEEHWIKWDAFAYFDESETHEAVHQPGIYPSLCIRKAGTNGTHTLYEWYSFKYGDPKASLGRGIQEGDHFFLHLEAPEITWESGSKNPPSITVLNGKMIGAEKAFSEAVAWNPGSLYKETSVFNLDMTKSEDQCDPDKDL